nr:MAG TPA_asm: terminase small subunit [Bacteriophage sp.]
MAKGKYEKWLKEENLLLLEGWARDGLTGNLKAESVRFMLILPCLRMAKPTDLTGVCTVPLMWIWVMKKPNASRIFRI